MDVTEPPSPLALAAPRGLEEAAARPGGSGSGPAEPDPRQRLDLALRRLAQWLKGLFGGALAAQAATAASLPEDRSELAYHSYDGGGVKATGPALLVRKSLADRVSFFGSYYVDAVTNASIDVVTTASPFKETRKTYDLGMDWLVRDSIVSLGLYTSREPDYNVNTASLDVSHEVFGGMSTVSLGFTRSSDEVLAVNEPSFKERARHWQYRAGLTQVLTPRWIASLNLEAVSDDGFLGSPYRAARVFGAAVPERMPRTRSSRAVKLRTIYDFGDGPWRTAVRAEYRHFWDNWEVKAGTWEIGASQYFGAGRWLVDIAYRSHAQDKALFYSDNAQSETRFVTRNRQLSTFDSASVIAKATWTPTGAVSKYDLKLSGMFERKQFRFDDFTDSRTGAKYAHDANLFQVIVSARF